MTGLKKKDKLYYARIIINAGVYDVCDLIVRTVSDENWFVAYDKRDKHAYLFYEKDLDNIIFRDRNSALEKVLIAEKNKPKNDALEEVEYEEY